MIIRFSYGVMTAMSNLPLHFLFVVYRLGGGGARSRARRAGDV